MVEECIFAPHQYDSTEAFDQTKVLLNGIIVQNSIVSLQVVPEKIQFSKQTSANVSSPLKTATGHPAGRHQTKGQVEDGKVSIWRLVRGREPVKKLSRGQRGSP